MGRGLSAPSLITPAGRPAPAPVPALRRSPSCDHSAPIVRPAIVRGARSGHSHEQSRISPARDPPRTCLFHGPAYVQFGPRPPPVPARPPRTAPPPPWPSARPTPKPGPAPYPRPVRSGGGAHHSPAWPIHHGPTSWDTERTRHRRPGTTLITRLSPHTLAGASIHGAALSLHKHLLSIPIQSSPINHYSEWTPWVRPPGYGRRDASLREDSGRQLGIHRPLVRANAAPPPLPLLRQQPRSAASARSQLIAIIPRDRTSPGTHSRRRQRSI